MARPAGSAPLHPDTLDDARRRARARPALPAAAPRREWRAWLLRTWPGRALVVGALVKVVTWPVSLLLATPPAALNVVDALGSLALLFAAAYGSARVVVWAKRRLLWRVRRKLILSYVFVGVVPVALIIVFFLLAGLLLFFSVSSYLVQARMQTLVDQGRFLAQGAALEVARATTSDALREALDRRQASNETRYPFASMAIVPVAGLACRVEPARAARVPRALPTPLPATAGPWRHLDPPRSLPAWVGCDGFGGLLAYDAPSSAGEAGAENHTRLVVRAVALPELPNPTWAVVLDLPVSLAVEQRLREETGVELGEITALPFGSARPPAPGRPLEARSPDPLEGEETSSLASRRWVVVLEYVDWSTGERATLAEAIRINLWDLYNRLSTVSTAGASSFNFGRLLLVVLALVGGLFLVIQSVALVIGLGLARQITGAIHDLFTGTEHVRAGHFGHQIPVRARDQLGELAESFNLMTAEVTALLGEMAEKGRMEQEMQAAREIQRKLLPAGPVRLAGLNVTAFCEPAREVAGDYYDFLPITDTMLGVLIADVAGKGLAAGLYMAQLKVIVQSLARLHHEPRAFLTEVNRIVSANLDPRSFITMSYGVVDLGRLEMTLARAGHCPLIHVPADRPAGLRKARLLAPDGLVVGLQIDDGTMFESTLQECTIRLAPGDLVIWFTDGISETMNERFDCFGEQRLAALVEQYAHLPFDQLRSYIMAELRAFAGGADPHDDMTMILMRVEGAA